MRNNSNGFAHSGLWKKLIAISEPWLTVVDTVPYFLQIQNSWIYVIEFCLYRLVCFILQGPMFKVDGDSDQFAEEAKYFTESRLLQRDVEIVLEGVSNANILGTIIHPVRNENIMF